MTDDGGEDESMTVGQAIAMVIAVLIFSGVAWILQNGKKVKKVISHAWPLVWVRKWEPFRMMRDVRKGRIG